METTESVVAEVSVALGTEYRLVRLLTGGLQSGAFELTDGGTRVVLKWSDDPGWAPRVRREAELVRRARAAGYPTPEWLAVGTTAAGSPYQLQEFVEGVGRFDASTIGPALARELIGICETQRGLVPEEGTNWSVWSRGVVFYGWDGVWQRVRGYSGSTAELMSRYDDLCRPYRDQALPCNDLPASSRGGKWSVWVGWYGFGRGGVCCLPGQLPVSVSGWVGQGARSAPRSGRRRRP